MRTSVVVSRMIRYIITSESLTNGGYDSTIRGNAIRTTRQTANTALTEYRNYKLQALANNSSMVRNGSAVQMICVSGALLMCVLLTLIYAFIQNFFIFRFDEIISFRFDSTRVVFFLLPFQIDKRLETLYSPPF